MNETIKDNLKDLAVFLAMIIIPTLLFIAFDDEGYTQEEVWYAEEEAREEGYNAGYEEGYDKGYEKGHEDGYYAGYNDK